MIIKMTFIEEEVKIPDREDAIKLGVEIVDSAKVLSERKGVLLIWEPEKGQEDMLPIVSPRSEFKAHIRGKLTNIPHSEQWQKDMQRLNQYPRHVAIVDVPQRTLSGKSKSEYHIYLVEKNNQGFTGQEIIFPDDSEPVMHPPAKVDYDERNGSIYYPNGYYGQTQPAPINLLEEISHQLNS